jgi:hypothetical protein
MQSKRHFVALCAGQNYLLPKPTPATAFQKVKTYVQIATSSKGENLMSKNKPFQPPAGFIIGVHQNIFGIRGLAEQLNLAPHTVAKGLEAAGYSLTPDIMDLSADAAKVILLQEKQGHLKAVNNDGADNNPADGGESPSETE